MEDKSFASYILEDYKKQNKRQFVIICILLGIIFTFVAGLDYVVTNYDFSYEDTVLTGDNNNYNSDIGGDVINGD